MTAKNQFRQEKMLLTFEEARSLLGLSRSSMYALLTHKDFPAIRISEGGKIYIPQAQLRHWVDAQMPDARHLPPHQKGGQPE